METTAMTSEESGRAEQLYQEQRARAPVHRDEGAHRAGVIDDRSHTEDARAQRRILSPGP